MKVDLSAYNNENCHNRSFVKRAVWLLIQAVFFKHSLAVGSQWKSFLLRCFGAHIGKGAVIKPSVTIKYPWLLTVGNHCWIGEHVWIDNLSMVTIADHVCISQGSYLMTGNHDYKKRSFNLITLPIVLEEGVWIGAGAILCPGVTAHTNAVLAAGSVATKNMESNYIYQGNPAIKIRSRIIVK